MLHASIEQVELGQALVVSVNKSKQWVNVGEGGIEMADKPSPLQEETKQYDDTIPELSDTAKIDKVFCRNIAAKIVLVVSSISKIDR
jgi:hypothetical protein